MTDLIKGGDFELEVQVLNEDGSVLPIDAATEILATIRAVDGRKLVKYALTGAGLLALVISDGPNGKFKIKLQSSQNIGAPAGKIEVHGKVTLPDATYENSTLDLPFIDKDKFQLVDQDLG